MKNILYKFLGLIFLTFLSISAYSQLTITAIIDATLSGGLPKAVEIYVSEDIPDLSIYEIAIASNGASSFGATWSFPSVSAASGDFITIAKDQASFNSYFGFNPDYVVSTQMNFNGNDVFGLFENGLIIDVYGVLGVDGTNETWEYENSFAYRKNGTEPSGDPFVESNWTIPGDGAINGCSTNATCGTVIPMGSYAAPLPIELLNFSLSPTDSQVKLNWSTATEQDNDYFQLERAGADRNFEPLAKIEGAVNSTVMQTYSYTDEAPLAGISYYRLVQVDLDGTVHYHNTLSYQDNAKGDLTLYPNPAKDQIIIGTEEMIGGVIELYDLSARLIQRSIITEKQSNLPLSTLQPGMYMISVKYNGLRLNNRFIKQ